MLSTGSSGERVLLHLPTGTYLLLDDAAARIVDHLTEDPDPAHAAQALALQFTIPFDQALADVHSVVDAVRGLSVRRVDRGRRPTLTGILDTVRAWLRQPWESRWSILRATVAVAVAEVGLAVTSLPRLARLMRVPLAGDRHVAIAEADNFGSLATLSPGEQRAHWAIDWVLARWLFDGTCLRRSLAFGWFIRRRRPILRLGMIDDGGTVAHAWVEAEGRIFDATAVTASFVLPVRRDLPDSSDVGRPGTGRDSGSASADQGRGNVEGAGAPPDARADDVPDGDPLT
jgi:hypothetical protein